MTVGTEAGQVVVEAPVRVADVGGWTDTWFGAPGRVCNLAVGPGVRVTVDVGRPAGVRLVLPDLAEDYALGPVHGPSRRELPGRHPLVEQAVASVLEGRNHAPGLVVTVRSAVPPGASLGTSAAVVVAVLAAIDAAVGVERPSAADLAARAHRVETDRVGREAGVQDQWAAACGGGSLLTVGPYPDVRRTAVEVAPSVADDLAARLVTVVVGAHDSSAVHREVIDLMVACGGGDHDRARQCFRRLATLAGDAADALAAGDLATWAAVLTAATDTQAELHPGLVGPAHHRAIGLARAHGALGWKVNGAGGVGGSLTVLLPDADAAAALGSAFVAAGPGWVVPDLRPTSVGVRLVDVA